jgi:hypothetical protein
MVDIGRLSFIVGRRDGVVLWIGTVIDDATAFVLRVVLARHLEETVFLNVWDSFYSPSFRKRITIVDVLFYDIHGR